MSATPLRRRAVSAAAALCAAALVLAPGCDDPDQALTCEQLTSEAEVAAGSAQANAAAALACKSNADCTVASTSSTCAPGCGAILTQAGAAQLRGAIAQINMGTCSTFASDHCPANGTPSCQTLVAVCVNGKCGGPTDAGAADGS